MPAGVMRNDGGNEQGQHDGREEPARAEGERFRQRGIESAYSQNRDESRPAWFLVILLGRLFRPPQRLQAVLHNDYNNVQYPIARLVFSVVLTLAVYKDLV